MEELTLHDYIAILKRQKKYFLLTFSVLWICSLIGALCWSNYRSSATVEIEQSEIASDMTTPMGMNPNDVPEVLADLRISKIEQKVTAPNSLVDIITKYNLYSGARKFAPMASIADKMRDKIKLNLVSSTVANPAAAQKVSAEQLSAIAFTLSFDYSDPHLAQEVTNEIVTRFLDEDLKERRAQAAATSEFLGNQIAAMEASLADQEKKIAEFQQAHGATRPESLMFNQQAAANTTMSLQTLETQISTNEGTQGALRAQLVTVDPYSRVIADGQILTTPGTQLKALEAQYTTLTAQYGPMHPDVIKIKHQIEALRAHNGGSGGTPSPASSVETGQLKAQIADVQTNLEAAKKSKGPDNPDVIVLTHQLKKLNEELASASNSDTPHDSLKKDADNPAYLELVSQLHSAEEQHKALVTQREQLVAQQNKYLTAIAENPALEQQMASLSRDYENAQLRYRDIKEKKMAADMDSQMVQERKGQRLLVINPPELPFKTYPSRLLLIVAGFVLSVIGGIAAIILVQMINQSIVGVQHLTSLVGVAPLVSIPHLYTMEEAGRMTRLKPYFVGGFIVLIIFTIVIFNFAIMPLDVVWSVVSQRLGLA